MIGCLRTLVRKQSIIALYLEFETAQLQRLARILIFFFAFSKFAFALSKYKGADQTDWMRRLVCAFAISMQDNQVFLR